MASYTSNYQLHQWVPEDDFLRSDFNEDFQKIDAGLHAAQSLADQLEAEKSGIVTGSYTGDGTKGRQISLGFYAEAVIVELQSGRRGAICEGGLFLRGKPMYDTNQALGGPDNPSMKITSTGFQVSQDQNAGAYSNTNGQVYYYLAVK